MNQLFDLEAFAEAAADAIIAARADGAIVFWNPAAERIFGFSSAEALGQSLDLIIPERFRARHWDGYHRVMATGKTKYGSACCAFRRFIKTAAGFRFPSPSV
jgi:PAS domain S-box-containing protein